MKETLFLNKRAGQGPTNSQLVTKGDSCPYYYSFVVHFHYYYYYCCFCVCCRHHRQMAVQDQSSVNKHFCILYEFLD